MNRLTPLLNVEDAARSIRFYTQSLNFTVDRSAGPNGRVDWAVLSCGPIRMMINASHERSVRGKRQNPGSYDDVVLYFLVDDAEKLREELLRKGLNPGPVERMDYGADEFSLRDPDGYELAFASAVPQ
jgi:uncharacterized glyoxalase superfamily protein PhnB